MIKRYRKYKVDSERVTRCIQTLNVKGKLKVMQNSEKKGEIEVLSEDFSLEVTYEVGTNKVLDHRSELDITDVKEILSELNPPLKL